MKDTKKKLTKAQERALDIIKGTIAKAKCYETFQEYWDCYYCHYYNAAWRDIERWQKEKPEELRRTEKCFLAKKNEQICLAPDWVKTETLNVLEREGYIKILKTAEENYGFEEVKYLGIITTECINAD